MKIFSKFSLYALTSVLILTLSPAQMASANTQFEEVSSKMTELGVAVEDQAAILQNLEGGILPLSDTPGSTPVSSSVSISQGFQHEILVFADASIKRISQEIPKSKLLRSTGLNACSVSSGTGYVNYVNCTVYNDTPLVTMGFISNFTIVQGGYNDYITNAINPVANCRLGVCSNLRVWVGKSRETTSGKAWAKMTADYTLYGGLGSSSYSLQLTVGGNSYQLAG